MADIMERHNLLQKRLIEQGFNGAIVSFDWPSATKTLNYLEDRSDAKATALKLVKDGIAVLARNQLIQDKNKCDIDVHLLGHSTGAYVIREAFYEAKHNRSLSRVNWNVSQVAFIGGDIARKSLSITDTKSLSLFEHTIRITNYQNPYDSALKVSNVKRLGTAPRIGRVGVPDDAHDCVVNVQVGEYWSSLNQDDSSAGGNWSHSWHFDDPVFAKDLYLTLQGDIDRHSIPTRKIADGELILKG
jgi:esterase/lipase superfamily enzyme